MCGQEGVRAGGGWDVGGYVGELGAGGWGSGTWWVSGCVSRVGAGEKVASWRVDGRVNV